LIALLPYLSLLEAYHKAKWILHNFAKLLYFLFFSLNFSVLFNFFKIDFIFKLVQNTSGNYSNKFYILNFI
jgi:hypothetical protein